MRQISIDDFGCWRSTARQLLSENVSPAEVRLTEPTHQTSLFETQPALTADKAQAVHRVPPRFLTLAQDVGYHRSPARWNLLYSILWRLTHDQPHLLDVAVDDQVAQAERMKQQVCRDAHKAKAFIRFRKVARQDQEHFIAWHQPDHRVVRKIAPFFARRFKAMNWSILTPDESVTWDQQQLHFHDGVSRSQAPTADELEELWKTYYGSIFNPARVKIKMMKSEMPVRYWKTLPEAEIIDDLIAQAPERVKTMIRHQEGFKTTAADLIQSIPTRERSPLRLKQVAQHCEACGLYRCATQTVFGSGPINAKLVIVGEQPGDVEDQQGEPFVGPAGQTLRDAAQQAGLDLNTVYLTNAVKHFKFRQVTSKGGKRRIHQKPDARELRCCRPWLIAELEFLQPLVVLALGVTATHALFDRQFKLTQQRGQVMASDYCSQTLASWHPASILRLPDPDQAQTRLEQLTDDLKLAASCLR